jgi:dipeptidyl-peptidase 4
MRSSVLLLALAQVVAVADVGAQAKRRFATLAEANQVAALNGRGGPRRVVWLDGGSRYSFIATNPQTRRQEIRSYDPATGRDTLLFSGEGVTFPGTTRPFEYQSFQYSRDFTHLVFQSNFQPIYRRSGTADYYVYSLADKSLRLGGKGARTAELSPDGLALGAERDGDLYVTDLASGRETRLTTGATDAVYNGRFDWVYEEEFGLAQAWKWSPDSRRIAFWQIDESKEPVAQLTDYSGRHETWDRIRYPQPGDSNPVARVGVVDVRTGRQTWLDPKIPGEFYIPRIYWTSRADTLAMLTLNRKQNELRLLFFDVNTGGMRTVLTETAKDWIDVYDFYAGVMDLMTFPEKAAEFYWVSDRDGRQHIYRYDYSGRLIQQVTKGPWSVTRIEGVDPASRTIYFTGTNPSPLERQLWAVRVDGTGLRRVTTTPGTHAINMAPNARYFIDAWSSTTEPRQVELWSTARGKLRTLEGNDAAKQWLAANEYAPTELVRFTTSDGAKIDASVVKPVPFDPAKKYPVVFSIYGGPGSQGVYDSFAASGWTQWLAQNGYVVVNVNNRGTNNYGREFMKVVYKNLGKYEAMDFAETAKYLRTRPWVDGDRIGIMGTSYGGYGALFAMEQYPDVFSAGIANSAVADWRLYDTIYTERYMSTLDDNAAGYEASSPIANASKLKGKLLLIHAMMDDNVHPQNTMQLLTALTSAGKNVDLRIFPKGRHGSAYDLQSSRVMNETMFEFLERHLKGPKVVQ